MAPGTAAQASAGSRVSDGNAHRVPPIRTHGAPPQERQIARSVLGRGPSSRHPVLVRTQPADTTATPPTSHTCPRRESPGQHNVYTTFVRQSRRRGARRLCNARLAGPRGLDQRPDPPVRQMVRDVLLRTRHGRMGGRCAPVSEKSPPKDARHAPGADVSDLIRLSKRSATRICAPRAGMSTRSRTARMKS